MRKAISGDRAQMLSAKEHLEALVAAGKASRIQRLMLRALCRQVGDMSCADTPTR